jgi:hypothetical protein
VGLHAANLTVRPLEERVMPRADRSNGWQHAFQRANFVPVDPFGAGSTLSPNIEEGSVFEDRLDAMGYRLLVAQAWS